MNPANLSRENLSPKQKLALYERLRSIPTPQVKAVKVEENYDYRFEPAKYIHDKLRIKLWRGTAEHPGLVEIVEAYELALRQQHEKRQFDNGERTLTQLRYWQPDMVIQNRIRLAGGHGAGKTLTMACLIRHFFDCFLPSVSYVFAPGLEQIKSNIWKEIGKVTLGRGLPGRLLQGMLTDDSRSDHFVKARAVPENTESIQGQHEAYQMIVGDEAEGLADAFWDSLDALTSGGISIILLSANPRTRASRFHRIGADPRVVSFQLNCLYHPNILQNREVVPSASTRDWAEGMLRDHCSIVDVHDEDQNTFEVMWRKGVIYQPDPEFMFRVKGLAPANVSDKNLIPVGRFEAACKRQPTQDRPQTAYAGLDVAWFGLDVGTLYCRHNGAVWRAAVLSKQEPSAYYFAVLKLAKELKAKGVKRFHLRVDAGGGFGSGVIEMCKTSVDLKQLFDEVKVYLVHFGATGQAVKDQEHYYDVITELTADFGESLKGLAILNAPPSLEQDLCEREWVPMNVAGKFVKKLEPKKDFRRRIKRSPDDGDGCVLAGASEFFFEEKIIGVVRW